VFLDASTASAVTASPADSATGTTVLNVPLPEKLVLTVSLAR
jgi:hypothetical protein